jgi:hypothetical protein
LLAPPRRLKPRPQRLPSPGCLSLAQLIERILCLADTLVSFVRGLASLPQLVLGHVETLPERVPGGFGSIRPASLGLDLLAKCLFKAADNVHRTIRLLAVLWWDKD